VYVPAMILELYPVTRTTASG